jgi:hypothetical protein
MGPFQLGGRDPVQPAGSGSEDASREETGISQVRSRLGVSVPTVISFMPHAISSVNSKNGIYIIISVS